MANKPFEKRSLSVLRLYEDENENEMIMEKLITKWTTWTPYIQSLLRIIAAAMFITAGTMKLFAFPTGMPPDGETAQLMSQTGIGGILEAFGGALVLLGLFTRPVAFLLAGEMAVAYFQFHAPQGFWPIVNGGQPAILYCFIWLYFSAAGAGAWSIDGLLRRRKTLPDINQVAD